SMTAKPLTVPASSGQAFTQLPPTSLLRNCSVGKLKHIPLMQSGPLLKLIVVAALLFSGCAFHRPELVLDPIGPPAGQPIGGGSKGSLRVFSAFDPAPDFNGLPYRPRYSSYTIFTADGRLVQTVTNRNLQRESPETIDLPAGAYRLQARANGYGMITVPVVI